MSEQSSNINVQQDTDAKDEMNLTLFEKAQRWKPLEASTLEDTKKLYTVLTDSPVHCKTIIIILAGSCRERRNEIVQHYHSLYGEDLVKVLDEKIYKGSFRKLLLGLMTPLAEYYARAIHDTFRFCRRDSHTLIDILTTIEPEVLTETNKVFHQLYKMTIESMIKCNITSSQYQRMLVLLSLNRRTRTEEIDEDQVAKDVLDLYNDGGGIIGRNSGVFVNVLTLRSKTHLLRVSKEYENYADIALRTAILHAHVFGMHKEILHVYDILCDFEGNRAGELRIGITKNHDRLVRLAISLAECDRIVNIKAVYKEKFRGTLKERITTCIRGDFRDCLLTIFYGKIKQKEKV